MPASLSPSPDPSPVTPPPSPPLRPKKPRSAAQAAASRANGARSAGPVSEAGKARSRLNGLTHGLSGQVVDLLPQVDATGFSALKQGVRAESAWLEEAELDQLAAALWLRARATAHEMAVLAGLDAQIRAGAFRAPEPTSDVAEARDAAADRQLKRLLLFARYGTRIRRELDRLTALLAPKEEARPGTAVRPARARAAGSAGPGSPPSAETSEIKRFSGSVGNIQRPPPLPTDPDADRTLRRLNLEVLGLDGTETFILDQLRQQDALGVPPAELLLETDRTLAFWASDGVELPQVQRWRDRLAARLTVPAATPAPAPAPAGSPEARPAAAPAGSPEPRPAAAPAVSPEPRPAPRTPRALAAPEPARAAAAPDVPPLPDHETLEEQTLRLFREPVPRKRSDLALADSVVANLCYRKKEAFGGIRLFDLLDLLDRLRDSGRLPHPDILNRLGADAFATAHEALFGGSA